MNRVLFSSMSVEWATPVAVYEKLNYEFNFNLDPCPLNSDIDGTSPLFVWSGHRVFCNPPYNNINNFLIRGPEAEIAVFLIPSRTDVRWFHDLVLGLASEIRFLRGRLKFGESKNNAPFPSMVVIFRK